MAYAPEEKPASLDEMWIEHRRLRDAVDRMELEIAKLSTEGCHVHATTLVEHAEKIDALDSEVKGIRGQLAELKEESARVVFNVTRSIDIATATRGAMSRVESELRTVSAHLKALVNHAAPSTKDKRSPFDV